MPNVYAPSVPTRYDPVSGSRIASIDLRGVMPFGELNVMITEPHPIDNDQLPSALHLIQEAIAEIRPEDYVVAVGDPILIAAAVAYASDINGSVKVLRWSRALNGYQVLEVTL